MQIWHIRQDRPPAAGGTGEIAQQPRRGGGYLRVDPRRERRRLTALTPRPADPDHAVTVREIEEDWFITFEQHPMEKGHFFRFAAYVTADRCLLVRLYPEQGGEVRIPQLRGGGKLYLCCSRDGLFEVW